MRAFQDEEIFLERVENIKHTLLLLSGLTLSRSIHSFHSKPPQKTVFQLSVTHQPKHV